MIIHPPHRLRKGYELKLLPGERKLASWMAGASAYTWLFATMGGLIVATGVGFFASKDGAAGMAIASVLSANMMLFAALGRRRLTLTDQRLVLQRRAKDEQSLELEDVASIEVTGRRLGRVSIAARSGSGIKASVYAPLKVAAEIQAACAAVNEAGDVSSKGGRA